MGGVQQQTAQHPDISADYRLKNAIFQKIVSLIRDLKNMRDGSKGTKNTNKTLKEKLIHFNMDVSWVFRA